VPQEEEQQGIETNAGVPAIAEPAPLLTVPMMFLSQQPRDIFLSEDMPMIAVIVLLSLIFMVELVIAAALLYFAPRGRLRSGQRPGQQLSPNPLEEQFLQLNRLRDQGVLSAEEYQQKRADILRRL
jgi:Short C-terminal domain